MSKFYILGIETSCDDTSMGIIDSDYKVLSNIISSQPDHELFGGVVPELASRLHLKNILPILQATLEESKLAWDDIAAIAVSVNPGLIGSLLVGLSFAKSLAFALKKPLICVNHMIGHLYANKIAFPDLKPPYLALVISGGHTELVNFRTQEDFTVVGKTRDDASGEAFDKVAKILKLGYPGGPVIDRLAKKGDRNFVSFPRGLEREPGYDFSYSGLKTSIMNYVKNQTGEFIAEHLSDIAASAQEAIIEILVTKTLKYAKAEGIKKIVLAGGVSANSRLRELFEEKIKGLELFYPPLKLCMDNGAMIAAAAVEKYLNQDFSDLSTNAFSTKGIRII